VSDFLRTRVERGDVPAVVAAVVNRDEVIYIGAFGKRDVAANSAIAPDALFRIASMTKPVTSLAVMMLVEEGKVALDDPIEKHLPDYTQPRVITRLHDDGTFDSRPANRGIRIRDLLTNTSGIGYAFSDPTLARLDQAKVPEAELPLLHDPGAKWTYGSSTAVLGRMVERVSGLTLDAFDKTRIFDPLGMIDTFYVVPADKRGRVVTQHQKDATGTVTEQPNPAEIRSGVRGDGGLFSTARDYAAFTQLFLNGGRRPFDGLKAGGDTRLVSERTVAMMLSNQIGSVVVGQQPAADVVRTKPFPIGAGKDTFGFGFQIETAPSQQGMRSAGSGSWAGIYNTHFWIDPQKQIAGVVLMQVLPFYDDRCIDLLRGFERTVYQRMR
ncbi:MAG TPA: serine hydrolase domain-containing protein, partial [Vicinamibacterales bacterium]|nr:serine hydrolase domain-containing protein [Vicinamibacterales bacterium]